MICGSATATTLPRSWFTPMDWNGKDSAVYRPTGKPVSPVRSDPRNIRQWKKRIGSSALFFADEMHEMETTAKTPRCRKKWWFLLCSTLEFDKGAVEKAHSSAFWQCRQINHPKTADVWKSYHVKHLRKKLPDPNVKRGMHRTDCPFQENYERWSLKNRVGNVLCRQLCASFWILS